MNKQWILTNDAKKNMLLNKKILGNFSYVSKSFAILNSISVIS